MLHLSSSQGFIFFRCCRSLIIDSIKQQILEVSDWNFRSPILFCFGLKSGRIISIQFFSAFRTGTIEDSSRKTELVDRANTDSLPSRSREVQALAGYELSSEGLHQSPPRGDRSRGEETTWWRLLALLYLLECRAARERRSRSRAQTDK